MKRPLYPNEYKGLFICRGLENRMLISLFLVDFI